MDESRRQFLKISTLGGAAASVLGFDLTPAHAQVRELKIARTTETRSTCPYCGTAIKAGDEVWCPSEFIRKAAEEVREGINERT